MKLSRRALLLGTLLTTAGCHVANRFAPRETPDTALATWVGSIAYEGHGFGEMWRPRTITLEFRRIDLTTRRYVKGGEEFQIVRQFDGADSSQPQLEVLRLRPGLYGAWRATIDWDSALGLPPSVQNTPDMDINIVFHGPQIEYPLVDIEVRPGVVTYGGEAVLYVDLQHGSIVIQPAFVKIRYDETSARRLLGPEVSSDTTLTVVPIR